MAQRQSRKGGEGVGHLPRVWGRRSVRAAGWIGVATPPAGGNRHWCRGPPWQQSAAQSTQGLETPFVWEGTDRRHWHWMRIRKRGPRATRGMRRCSGESAPGMSSVVA